MPSALPESPAHPQQAVKGREGTTVSKQALPDIGQMYCSDREDKFSKCKPKYDFLILRTVLLPTKDRRF